MTTLQRAVDRTDAEFNAPAGPDLRPAGQRLRLVAAEWFVPAELAKERPSLFGHPFDGPMEGHNPLMPASMHHYDLHVWLWKDNPAGLFSPTNPALHCPAGPYSVKDNAPKLLAGEQ